MGVGANRIVFLVARVDHTSIVKLTELLVRALAEQARDVEIIEWRRILETGYLRRARKLFQRPGVTTIVGVGALADVFACAVPPLFPGRKFFQVSWLHCFQWEDLIWERNPALAIPYFLIWRLSLYLKHSIVTVSRAVRESLPAALTLKAVVIHNPVEEPLSTQTVDVADSRTLASFNRLRASGYKIVFSFGLFRKRKNFEFTIRALRDLPDFAFVLVGAGEDGTRLRSLAESLGVADRLQICQFTSRPARLCRYADVYVSNTHSEGFGLANVEAAMTGIPVVVPDLPVNVEVLGSFPRASFYQTGDSSAFCRAIRAGYDSQVDRGQSFDSPYRLTAFAAEWTKVLFRN